MRQFFFISSLFLFRFGANRFWSETLQVIMVHEVTFIWTNCLFVVEPIFTSVIFFLIQCRINFIREIHSDR